jgi:hypothetical protein
MASNEKKNPQLAQINALIADSSFIENQFAKFALP